jgi:hypothetical protein
MTEDAGREPTRCEACGQLSGDYTRQHVDLLRRLKAWVDEYQMDEETCVTQLATATADLWYTAHHTLKRRLESWEQTAAQLMGHTRRN